MRASQRGPRLALVGVVLLSLLAFVSAESHVARAEPPKPPKPESAASGAYALSFSGSAVSFDVSGMEPDFDPIYRIIVSGTLHDLRPAGWALPDAMLVLSAYLEAFQPDTTPILPDLLHPNQTAQGLGGFLTGKAALVNAGGHIVYHGDLLAEVFQDSTEHLIVDLYPQGAGPNASAIRLQGSIVLRKGGAESGTLRALHPLARASLAVPRRGLPSWQTVIRSLSVPLPPMMGTGAAPGQHGPGQTVAPVASMGQSGDSAGGPPAVLLRAAGGAGLVLLTAVALVGRRAIRRRQQAAA